MAKSQESEPADGREAALRHMDVITSLAYKWQRNCHDEIVDVDDLINDGVKTVIKMWHLRPKYQAEGRSVKASVYTLAKKGITGACYGAGAIRVPEGIGLAHARMRKAGGDGLPDVARARNVGTFADQREDVSQETSTQYDPADDAGVRRLGDASARSADPARDCIAREALANVRAQIARLPALQCIAIRLHTGDNVLGVTCTPKQIGEFLHCSQQKVYQLIKKARKQLMA